MKKLFLLLFSVLAFTSQVRADVDLPISTTSLTIGDWDKDLYCSKEWCNILEEGDIIYGTVTTASGYQIQLYHDWTFISNFDYSDGKISYTLTESDVTNLKANGMRVRGKNITLTSLYLKKSKSIIKTSIAASGSTGNWGTSVDFPENSLNTAVENDYVMVSVTPSDNDAQGKVGMSSNGTDTYSFNSYVNAFYGFVTADMASEETKNGYVQGKNIAVTGAALYHPVNSFKIGSIGMATFSANQEVTVPEGLTAYKAAVSGNNVTLTPFTNNVIPANTGAIIEGPQGSVVEFAATSTGSSEESALEPVTTATEVTSLSSAFDYYVLYAGTGEREDDLELSTLLGSWGGWHPEDVNWNGTTYTITYNGKASGEGGGVKQENNNWSTYDKLKLNFSANTLNADATFYVAYNGQGEDATTHATLAQGSTSSIEIDLNSTYKNAIGDFSMWSNATGGSLTFASAALIDNDGATVAEFRKTTKGTLAANKAYLKLDSGSSGSNDARLSLVFNDEDSETTGVLDVQKHTTQSDNVYYNLRGMQVDKPTKGLYIMNGKKVFVK